MATKVIKGPLSMAAPDEETATDYNGTMKDLLGQLVQSPEDAKKDSMLAWAGGLGTGADGSGLGGALGRATKSESDWRTKDRELKAQYIPLIMNAVAAQQAAGIQQKLVGSIGQKPIAQMTLEEVNALENQGGQKGLTEKWKLARQGLELKQGWNVMPQADGSTKRVYIADPTKGVGVDEQNNVVELPGAGQALGAIAGAQERGKLDAQTDYEMVPGIMLDGTPGMVAKRKMLADLGSPAGQPRSAPGAGPAPVPAVGAPVTPPANPGGTLGAQNNNPGNLRPAGASTGFQKFPTPEAGLAALDQNLLAYGKQGVNTIGGVISKWAPPSENNTSAYIKGVSQRLGVPADQPLDMSSPYVRHALSTAIMLHENGPNLLTRTAAAPQAAPGATAPGFVATGRSPAQKAGDEALTMGNTEWMKTRYSPTLEAGDSAKAMMDNLNTARIGLKRIGDGTGWGGEKEKAAAEFLGYLGVKNASEKATGYQQFQQAGMTQVNSVLNLAKGPQTDQDARRAQQTFAGIEKTPQANQFLLDYAQAVAERQKRRSDFYQQAMPLARSTGDLTAVDRSWSKIDKSIWDNPVMRRWNKKE